MRVRSVLQKSCLVLLLPCLFAGGVEKWKIDDIVRLKKIGSSVISPDGRFVLYSLSGSIPQANRQYSDLYVVTADGTKNVRLTEDGMLQASPQWIPGSDRVSFLAPDQRRRNQVWSISANGGVRTQVTAADGGVRSHTWSPSGAQLLYVTGVPRSAQRLAPDEDSTVISFEDPRVPAAAVWLMDVAAKHVTRLAEGPIVAGPRWSPDGRWVAFSMREPRGKRRLFLSQAPTAAHAVTPPDADVLSFAWAPNSKAIACVLVTEDPQPYLNFFTPSRMYPASGHVAVLSVPPGPSRDLFTEEYPGLSQLYWSRGSSKLVFAAKPPGTKDNRFATQRLYLVNANGSKPVPIGPPFDFFRGAPALAWSRDDQEIWFVEGERMGFNVLAVNTLSGQLRHVTRGQDCIGAVTYTSDFSTAAFVKHNFNLKPDIYVAKLPGWEARQITDVNPEVRHFEHGQGEIITYSSEGRILDGLLVKPPGFVPTRKYPLILVVHGGPAWSKKNEWSPEWECQPIQAYAAEGYILVFPNVRGSWHYGAEFRLANYGDLGGGDYRDAMAAVDYLIGQGYVDADRLGVAGWSYGGFLGAAIVTKTDRFKAAQIGGGFPSYEAMYGRLTSAEIVVHENYGKRPWEDPQMHIRDSPLYAAMKVKTPTLIVHGGNDDQCPASGSILFYRALKFYGVPAVLEIYPGEGHGIGSPLAHRRCLRRNLEWFNKWLKGDRNTSFETRP